MERITEKGWYRNLAMYVLKKQTGLTNKEIGRHFGSINYSAVTKNCERLESCAKTDRSLQHKIKKLTAAISQVKG
jgi:chromosomal replication initiation ATPase DnaA